MRHAFRIKNINFLYVNLIIYIYRLHQKEIPLQIAPNNLFHGLSNIGWINDIVSNPPNLDPKWSTLINNGLENLILKSIHRLRCRSKFKLNSQWKLAPLLNYKLLLQCLPLPMTQTTKLSLIPPWLHLLLAVCKISLDILLTYYIISK
jgi:hypothetical protein